MDKPVRSIPKQALAGLAAFGVLLWLALFLPAWSLDYWQVWTYWLVFLVSVTAISVCFLKKDLNLIENRLKAVVRKKRGVKNSQIPIQFMQGALLMPLFTPVALGSFWGLFVFLPTFAVIALRILEEEKFLTKNLPEYAEYCQKIRYRLVPFIWQMFFRRECLRKGYFMDQLIDQESALLLCSNNKYI